MNNPTTIAANTNPTANPTTKLAFSSMIGVGYGAVVVGTNTEGIPDTAGGVGLPFQYSGLKLSGFGDGAPVDTGKYITTGCASNTGKNRIDISMVTLAKLVLI